MSDLQRGETFKLTGDDLCPKLPMKAVSSPYIDRAGCWAVEVEDLDP